MNTKEQRTFVDALRRADDDLTDLLVQVERLADRLVGYGVEAEAVSNEISPVSGLLPGATDRADRMCVKIGVAHRQLQRIADHLPDDVQKAVPERALGVGLNYNSYGAHSLGRSTAPFNGNDHQQARE